MSTVPIRKYLPLARKIAEKIAWSPDDVDDLVQAGILELLKAFESPSGKSARDPEAFAAYVLRAWMQWQYTPADRSVYYVPVEDYPLAVDTQAALFSGLHLDRFRNDAQAELLPDACRIMDELLSPGPQVIGLAYSEMLDKQRRFAQGEAVRGHSTLVIAHRHIAAALNLTESEWISHLSSVRSFTRNWLRKTGSTLSAPM